MIYQGFTFCLHCVHNYVRMSNPQLFGALNTELTNREGQLCFRPMFLGCLALPPASTHLDMFGPELCQLLDAVPQILEGQVGLRFPQPHGNEFLLKVSHRVVWCCLPHLLLFLLQLLNPRSKVTNGGLRLGRLEPHLAGECCVEGQLTPKDRDAHSKGRKLVTTHETLDEFHRG